MFNAGPMLEPVLEAMAKGSITVSFTRQAGGLDIFVPIDTVLPAPIQNLCRTTSKQMMVDFINCSAIVVNGPT